MRKSVALLLSGTDEHHGSLPDLFSLGILPLLTDSNAAPCSVSGKASFNFDAALDSRLKNFPITQVIAI